MKRYPKRARPLWGRGSRKSQAPIVYIYGPLHIALEGEDITGATVREVFEWPENGATVTSATKFRSAPRVVLTQSKMRADIKINVTIGDSSKHPPSSLGDALVLMVDPEGGPVMRDGEVLTLPPVEVRL